MPQDCSTVKCDSLRQEINEVCRANGWPVGHNVLVCDATTGTCCNCECTVPAAVKGVHDVSLIDCPEGLAYGIQGYIDRACEEAGTDSVVVVFTDGSVFRAYKL